MKKIKKATSVDDILEGVDLEKNWLNILYYIGRTLEEIKNVTVKKEDRDNIIKEILVRLASAGGHCVNAMDQVSTIYESAKKIVKFTDEFVPSPRSVDDKIDAVLYKVREKILYQKVANFEGDKEPKATEIWFSNTYAESVGLYKLDAGRALGSETRICLNEFNQCFYVGKVAYEGYTPRAIFTALWNVLYHPGNNSYAAITGQRFYAEFVEKILNDMPNPAASSSSRAERVAYYKKMILMDDTPVTPQDLIDITDQALKGVNIPDTIPVSKEDKATAEKLVFRDKKTSSLMPTPKAIINYLVYRDIIKLKTASQPARTNPQYNTEYNGYSW
jgi:hypothetical protein